VERLLNVDNLYDPRHMAMLHHVNQALKAMRCSAAMSTMWSRMAK